MIWIILWVVFWTPVTVVFLLNIFSLHSPEEITLEDKVMVYLSIIFAGILGPFHMLLWIFFGYVLPWWQGFREGRDPVFTNKLKALAEKLKRLPDPFTALLKVYRKRKYKL